jgi:putative chitinase
MLTREQFGVLTSNLAPSKREEYYPFLTASMEEFGITSRNQQRIYLPQLLHESTGLSVWIENLNYSASGLLRVFPRYFSAATAAKYARQPQKIANRVYANRGGNGDEASGDGWTYRGRCPIQATLKEMYLKLRPVLGVDCVADPDLLLKTEYGFRAAAWIFAVEKNLLDVSQDGDERALKIATRRINGGTNGWEDRLARHHRACKVIV